MKYWRNWWHWCLARGESKRLLNTWFLSYSASLIIFTSVRKTEQTWFSWWVPLLGRNPLGLQHTDLCFDYRSPDPLHQQAGIDQKNIKDGVDATNFFLQTLFIFQMFQTCLLLAKFNPPASEARKEVSKFNWRKKSAYPHIWFQRICLSVCPSVNKFDPNFLIFFLTRTKNH